MKIIAVGMNYALHNQELGHVAHSTEPVLTAWKQTAHIYEVGWLYIRSKVLEMCGTSACEVTLSGV